MSLPVRAIVGGAVVVGAVWLAVGRDLVPESVETAAVVSGEAVDAVYATGTAEAVRTAVLRAPVAGTWTNVTAMRGAHVEVEQTLGQIATPTLAYDLQHEEVRLRAAEDRADTVPGVRALRAESAAVEARADLSRMEIDRVIGLVGRGIESQQTLDRLRTELAELEARTDALRAQRRDAEQGTDADAEAQRLLVLRARALLEQTYVRAPFDGVVLERLAEPAEWVAVGQDLLRIGDVSAMRVEAEIDEADVRRVRLDAPARIAFHAMPEAPFEGRVVEVGAEADRERGTYPVVIAIDAPAGALAPGLTAEVNIVARRIPDAVLVPNAAVDGDRVWRIDEGRVREVRPEWGVRGRTHTQVLAGVAVGDRVIVGPSADLRDGARVRVEAP